MRLVTLRSARDAAALFACVLAGSPLAAQHSEHDPSPTAAARARSGTISFPTSGPAQAQPDFVRGVLYMHSFEYGAAAAFLEAQRKAPEPALAYWGEAMTHTHAIWNEQDLSAAREVLARLGPTATGRAAKADVATRYPDDEANAFLSLAIMGLSQGVRNVDAYMRAGAIALRVQQRNPDHPGAAHYVIHAFDDPTHAPLGLDAARAYSGIAPGAAHAQHMTTHIFLALGMWPEVISQNIAAAGPDTSRWQAGHYTYWLHYGYLQAGRFDDAARLLSSLRAHASGPESTRPRRAHLALARAQQIITGERWNDPSLQWDLPFDDVFPAARAADAFARGFAALERGDVAAAAAISASSHWRG